MEKIREEKLALRISAAILIQNGEISIDEIQSLPFLTSDINVRRIADSLVRLFGAELVCKKISSHPFLRWEETIQLKKRYEGHYT